MPYTSKGFGEANHLGMLPNFSQNTNPGLARSQSFGGFLNRKPSSLCIAQPILGESFRNGIRPVVQKRSATVQGLNSSVFKKGHRIKMPKVPRPHRAFLLFESAKRGLDECIKATQEDITEKLKESGGYSTSMQVRLTDVEKQVKAAERHKKQLEFHLSKVEELEDSYKLQHQMREGVRSMAKAFKTQTQSPKKSSLENVKFGYKECSQTMCAIEAQLENLLGTFHCQMKGLVGFARMMTGDVYKVVLKHGYQKWKSQTHIGINTQQWDSDFFKFKVLVGDGLQVKVSEMRRFKSVQLCDKICEISKLFSSNPHMMKIDVNTNGSMKLSIIVTWDPLEAVDESFVMVEPGMERPLAPRQRVQSMYLMNTSVSLTHLQPGRAHSSLHLSSPPAPRDIPNIQNYTFSSFDSFLTPRRDITCSQPVLHHPEPSKQQQPQSVAVMGTIDELTALDTSKGVTITTYNESVNSTLVYDPRPIGSVAGGNKTFHLQTLSRVLEMSEMSVSNVTCSKLQDALNSLQMALEDFRGQHAELRKVEEQVDLLSHELFIGNSNRTQEDMGISVEDALGAFDFLEHEYFNPSGSIGDPCNGSIDSGTKHSLSIRQTPYSTIDTKSNSLSPESTAKTSDSGIECLAMRLEDHSNTGVEDGRRGETPASTGNNQVDEALIWHLGYCHKLLECLGCFGPLKCKEIYALEKLQRQADILEHLLSLAHTFPGKVSNLQKVMSELSKDKELRKLWVRCTEQNVLCVRADRLFHQLERSYWEWIKREIRPASVFKTLIARVLDLPYYDPEVTRPHPIVTLHQFFFYMQWEAECDIIHHVQQLAEELWLSNRLQSGNYEVIRRTMEVLRGTIPPPSCLRVLALLLLNESTEIRALAARYLQDLCPKESLRQQAVVVYVEALEEKSIDIRSGACLALKCLQATESTEHLVFVSETDSSMFVKERAKEALFSFGEEGIRAFQDSQLSAHGFQGVKIRL